MIKVTFSIDLCYETHVSAVCHVIKTKSNKEKQNYRLFDLDSNSVMMIIDY